MVEEHRSPIIGKKPIWVEPAPTGSGRFLIGDETEKQPTQPYDRNDGYDGLNATAFGPSQDFAFREGAGAPYREITEAVLTFEPGNSSHTKSVTIRIENGGFRWIVEYDASRGGEIRELQPDSEQTGLLWRRDLSEPIRSVTIDDGTGQRTYAVGPGLSLKIEAI